MLKVLLGPDGRPLRAPTLLDLARSQSPAGEMLAVAEELNRMNDLFWEKLRVLDSRGHPILKMEIK